MELSCLYLEDESRDYELFTRMIVGAFRGRVTWRFERAESLEKAIQVLQERAGMYQVFLIDLMAQDPVAGVSRAVGMEAASYAARYPHLVRIAISRNDDLGTRKEFLRAGGHDLLSKNWIMHFGASELRTRLESLLENHGILLGAPRLQWESDKESPLGGLVDEVGPTTLEVLLRSLAREDGALLRPQFLFWQPHGVYGLSVRTDVHSWSSANWLVLISRSEYLLRAELNNVAPVGTPGATAYLKWWHEFGLRSHNGWHAIAAESPERLHSLKVCLAEKQGVKPPAAAIRDLLQDGLGPMYRATASRTPQSGASLLVPPASARGRVLNSLNLTGQLLARLSYSVDFPMIAEWLRGETPATLIPVPGMECQVHGDLRVGQILVDADRWRAYALGAASRRTGHWATDIARLSVSLWIEAWDEPDAYFWDGLPHWREQIRQWCLGAMGPDTGELRGPVGQVLEYLRGEAPQLFGRVFNLREFHMALAVEFLQFSADEALPMPKRCLALLAATDLLKHVQE